MNSDISVSIDGSHFILSGDLSELLSNKRIAISLRRLNTETKGEVISIPFEENNQINVLNEVVDLLNKFNFDATLDNTVKEQLSTYHEELSAFNVFSEKARQIRDGCFDENIELVDNFKEFKSALENTIVRPLYKMQMLSAFHLAFAQNGCNFAVPGAGKTAIVYGAYAYLKNLPPTDSRHIDNLLVIGPLSSFAPWENEYKEIFGKKVSSQRLSGDTEESKPIHRSTKEQHLYSTNPSELTLISHAGISNLEREICDFLKRNKTMVVVDEAHRIKNVEGVWGKSAIEIAKVSKSRVILTGTPAPNGYEDLYNLYKFIYPYKYQEILNIHYDQLKNMTQSSLSLDDERVKTFVENIKPYFIRIKKNDLNLPPTIENIIEVEMDQQQRRIYDFIEDKYVKSFTKNNSGTVKDIFNKAKLIRLRQAASNPGLLLRPIQESFEDSEYGNNLNLDMSMIQEDFQNNSVIDDIKDYTENHVPPKFIAILDLLQNQILNKNGKVIIWTVFIQNTDELRAYLEQRGIKVEILIGRIPVSQREDIIEKFNDPSNEDFSVVIANPFSVSESISLHKGCHNAIYMERDYNASNFVQSKDRIHRVGLEEGVITKYYYLVCQNTIDTIINEKLDLKVQRMEKIIDQEIPLFHLLNDNDETDIIKALLEEYAGKT